MIAGPQLYARFYLWLARSYPKGFRAEFQAEMIEVFTDLTQETARRGRGSLLRVFLRELRDWPRVALMEHWLQLKRTWVEPLRISSIAPITQRRFDMDPKNDTELLLPEDKQGALIAGLPFVLFGLGIGLAAGIYEGPWYEVPRWRFYLSIGLGLVPMFAIGVGALIALLRRLPDWGWTWMGTAFMGVVLFVKTLVEEMAEEGRPLTTPAGELVILMLFLLIGGGIIGAGALRGWRRAGLVSLGLAGTLGLSLFMSITAAPFNRTDLALLALPIGAIMAWLVYHFGRGSDRLRLAIYAGMGTLNMGLVVLADRVWMEWLDVRGSASPLIPLLVFSALMLLAGPVAAWILKPIQRTLRRA